DRGRLRVRVHRLRKGIRAQKQRSHQYGPRPVHGCEDSTSQIRAMAKRFVKSCEGWGLVILSGCSEVPPSCCAVLAASSIAPSTLERALLKARVEFCHELDRRNDAGQAGWGNAPCSKTARCAEACE